MSPSQRPSSRRPSWRSAIWAVLLVSGPMAGVGCSITAPPSPAEAPAAPAPIAVRTYQVVARPVRQTFDYLGITRARYQSKVSARTAGVLLEQHVAEGDPLQAGRPIAKLESPEPALRLQGAKAELSRARSQRSEACRVSREDATLLKSKAVPKSRAAASKAACRAATLATKAARAKVKEVEIAAGYINVVSPTAGRALRWLAEPGDFVRPGQPILLVASGARELELRITDADLQNGIRVGGKVILRPPVGSTATSTVLRISPLATGPGRHLTVRVALPDTLQQLPLGSAVAARFIIKEDLDATPVPRRALVFDGPQKAHLFTVTPSNPASPTATVTPVAVTLGVSQGGLVSVHPRLRPGTRIATTNLVSLTPHASVYPVAEPASAAPSLEAIR